MRQPSSFAAVGILLLASVCAPHAESSPAARCARAVIVDPDSPALFLGRILGSFSLTCSPGFADCDNNPANGCEVNLTNDINNCGACGHVCQGACVNGQCQPAYTVTDLGTLGGSSSWAYGINALGQVVGESYTSTDFTVHGFRTAANSGINLATDDLGTLGTGGTGARGINSSGQVVGFSCLTDTFLCGFVIGDRHAFRTTANSPINSATDDLGTLGGSGSISVATAINNSGQAVGFSVNIPTERAFRTAANSPINIATDDLGTLGGSQTAARGINSSGQVVGNSLTTGDVANHAFRTAANGVINPATDDLGTLGGSSSVARGINDFGQVVGDSLTTGGTALHAFRTAINSPINAATDGLGTLGGTNSSANGINSAGQVVGKANTAGDVAIHAFLYSGGMMYDLNTLIPAGSGWELLEATAINDVGQIVGFGGHSGQGHAFLLTPANTPVGSNVIVQPKDATTGGMPVSLTFSTVIQSGNTTLATTSAGPVPPTGFKLGSPATYYNITTTAVFTGAVIVCVNYTGVSYLNPQKLRLSHYENGAWVDTTLSLNTSSNIVCGSVTSLSPFAVFEPAYSANVQPPISPDGSSVFSASRGVVPVKFTLTLNNALTCTLPPAIISVTRTAGGTPGGIGENTYSMAADSGSNFRIDPTACQYVYNLAASSLGIGTYRVDISINGNVVGHGVFTLQ